MSRQQRRAEERRNRKTDVQSLVQGPAMTREVRLVVEIFAELERAGLIRRTGEYRNGQPMFERTAMSAEKIAAALERLEAEDFD